MKAHIGQALGLSLLDLSIMSIFFLLPKKKIFIPWILVGHLEFQLTIEWVSINPYEVSTLSCHFQFNMQQSELEARVLMLE